MRQRQDPNRTVGAAQEQRLISLPCTAGDNSTASFHECRLQCLHSRDEWSPADMLPWTDPGDEGLERLVDGLPENWRGYTQRR